MKGFVVTIIALSLVALLFVLSTSLRNNYLSNERSLSAPQPLIYGAFLFDSIAMDVNSLIGPVIQFNQMDNSLGIAVTDSIPKGNISSALSTYGNFLNQSVADQTHSSINANFSNLTSGVLTVYINRDYLYTNNEYAGEMEFTAPGGGGTNATSYDINVTVLKTRSSISPFNFNNSGNLNITLRFTDLNGTDIESGSVFSTSSNVFSVSFSDGSSASVSVGLNNGSSGSLVIRTANANGAASWYVLLPPLNETKKMGYQYDATLNYTQDRINIFRRIGR